MSQGDLKGLDTLTVWRKALDFASAICREVIPLMPSDEKYGMMSQLKRSVQSIPANIAEGYGRYYYQETVRYCYIARGSLEETYSHLTLANQLGYLTQTEYETRVLHIQELRRLINGYIIFLKRARIGENEAGAPKSIREPESTYQPSPYAMMDIRGEKYYP